MKHIYEKHTNCDKPNCHICMGGLAVCTVCGCYEGSLATECPGVPVDYDTQQDIYNGKIDFKDGRWQTLLTEGNTKP